MKISVVIPALNEEDVIESTINEIPIKELRDIGFDVEIIVVDNNSTDNTADIVRKVGAKVVREPEKGYGNAYLRGLNESTGDIIVMGDADGTYPFKEIPKFVRKITEEGADFVMGSRLKGKIHEGAMRPLHRYIGNPLLTGILNLLFRAGISDAHCGMRAFTREALKKMNLKTEGMEFASEMVIEASRKKLNIKEIPIDYFPRKGGEAKLHSFQDGWRHLRFMILYKPIIFLLSPGLLLFLLGVTLMVSLLLQGPVHRLHSLIFGGFMTIISLQVVSTGIYLKVYGVIHGVGDKKGLTSKFLNYHSLEIELFLGILLFLGGLILGLDVLYAWASTGFGSLSEVETAVISLVMASVGLQIIFLALFISVLLLNWDVRE
ncbi:MAG: glycosyltransferase family 2 protein [Candidatus Altiarchaeales archaeon]|nr:glycosyltransferase family 2 protein [Candidatus Altiarchaeales archaeon]